MFPATKEEVFAKLKTLKILQQIAWPYATFTPIGNEISVWEPNSCSSYKFKLFGLIPFGTHTIKVISFDIENGIYTHEGNKHVPVWNHRITLADAPDNQCVYSDIVDIDAGWKTPFVYLWAKCFYAHRQRKWLKILSVS